MVREVKCLKVEAQAQERGKGKKRKADIFTVLHIQHDNCQSYIFLEVTYIISTITVLHLQHQYDYS